MQFIRCCTSNVLMEINVELFIFFIVLQRTPENGNVLNGEAKKQLARESRVILSLMLHPTLLIERWKINHVFCVPPSLKCLMIQVLPFLLHGNLNIRKNPRNLSMKSTRWISSFGLSFFVFFSFSKAVVWCSFKNYEFLPEACSTCTQYSYYCLYSPDIFFMVILFSSVGKQRLANQVYFTRSKILWGQAYCCLPSLQIPSPMEVIWGWTNQCIWSYHSDNRCSNRGITDLCFTWFLYPGCLKIVTTVNPLVGPSKLNSFCLMAPRYFTGRMSEN